MENNLELLKPDAQSNLIQIPISKEQFEVNRTKPHFDGPISGPMWKRIVALNSQYPDTFDWSVYDRLYARFGDKQPRGGVVYGQTLKLANFHSSCSKCHYSLELDTYGRGCIHNCKYCYAKEQLVRRRYWNEPYPMPVDLTKIREIFHRVFETSKNSKWRPILEKKIPLRIGSMSDSFMWMDQKIGVTKELLKILNFYEYPYVIFTRSDLVAHDDYLKLLDTERCTVQLSINASNEELNRKLEPGAPSIARRFKALEKLAHAGVWTAVRLNPLFPTYPDGYFTSPSSVTERFGTLKDVPKLDLFPIEKTDDWMDRLQEAHVKTLIVGFVRLTQNAIAYIGRDAGLNFRAFFRPDLYMPAGESVYSDSEIAHYYKLVRQEAVSRGIRFSTCYIGNGIKDYYAYQKMWANKKDCCDVVGNVKGFKTSAQEVPWAQRMDHTASKEEATKAMIADKEATEANERELRKFKDAPRIEHHDART